MHKQSKNWSGVQYPLNTVKIININQRLSRVYWSHFFVVVVHYFQELIHPLWTMTVWGVPVVNVMKRHNSFFYYWIGIILFAITWFLSSGKARSFHDFSQKRNFIKSFTAERGTLLWWFTVKVWTQNKRYDCSQVTSVGWMRYGTKWTKTVIPNCQTESFSCMNSLWTYRFYKYNSE